MMSCNLQGNCSWKGAPCFSLSHRHALLQGVISDLQKAFGFGVHPTPLPHPDSSHQFWVNMAVGSGRETTWYGGLWQSPHHIDSTVRIRIVSFSYSFLYAKYPFRVVASFMAPTNPVTWRNMCMWRKLTWTLTPPAQWRDVTCACDASYHERYL